MHYNALGTITQKVSNLGEEVIADAIAFYLYQYLACDRETLSKALLKSNRIESVCAQCFCKVINVCSS